MNKAELAQNRILSDYLVLDLNENPRGLSSALYEKSDGKYDAAICSVSIDYLTKPREVLEDLSTLLKSGAGVHLSFSNRCFPSKASIEAPFFSRGMIHWRRGVTVPL